MFRHMGWSRPVGYLLSEGAIDLDNIGLGQSVPVHSPARSVARLMAMACCLLIGIAAYGARAHAVEVGASIDSGADIGGVRLPLPDGGWTVFYADETPEGSFPVTRLGLLRIAGKSVKQIAYVRVIRNARRGGFKPFEQCALPHYFFSETVTNQTGGAQDCWHVRTETLAADTPSPRQAALTSYAKANGLFLPLTMIGSRFHMASRTVALRISYGWTPDLILKAPKDKKVWRFQDWTADAVATDPRKTAVMEKMKQWGSAWRPRVSDAFNGKTSG